MVKTSLILASVTAMVAPYLMAPAALAFDYPKEVYLVTYEVVTPTGKTELQQASNGKGMVTMKVKDAKSTYRYFADYKIDVYTTMMDSTKTARKEKLDKKTAETFNHIYFKKNAQKELGAKVVGGHPCHGYMYSAGGETGEVWIGDDCKILVFGDSGKTITTLKKLDTNPPASEFNSEIPSNYKMPPEKK